MQPSSSHVFISYNTVDGSSVRVIVDRLRSRGVGVWLDQDEIPPGSNILRAIDQGLKECTAIAAFVGSAGQGPWQSEELGAAFASVVRSGKTLIPVALPGTSARTADFPDLVKGNRFIEFHSLDDEAALDDLIWGITGVKPFLQAAEQPAAPAAADPLVQMLADFTRDLRSSNLAIFVGSSSCGLAGPAGAENSRVAQVLLQRLGHSGEGIVAPVDFIGRCYEIKGGTTELEEIVSELGSEYADSAPAGDLHGTLADLLVMLRAQRPPRQLRGAQHIVVTTNLDTSLERRFLAAGLGFSRLVQRRKEPLVAFSRHEARLDGGMITLRAGERETTVRADDLGAALAWIAEGSREIRADALRNEDLGDLILYKVRGCAHLRNGATLTTPQFFELARNAIRGGFIPADVERLIGDSHALFLGYCMLDPDLHLLHHALLQRQFKEHAAKPRYAAIPSSHVHVGGFRELEELVGAGLHSESERELQVRILDVEPVQMLHRLIGHLTSGPGGGRQ